MPEDTEVKPSSFLVAPTLIREPRKPTIFKGEPGQDPTEWLKEYLRVSKFNQWDDTLSLANVYFFLDGTAKRWFENNEDSLISWNTFEDELKNTFGNAQLYVKQANDRLKSRAQKFGEATQSYIQDVLGLCQQADPSMAEDDKIAHLLKGVAEDIYQALLTKEIKTVADFIKWCQYIEERNQKRIGRQKFSRLPNVVPMASIDSPDLDLTSLIRSIVREEIQKLTSLPTEEPDLGLQTIEAIVREEVGRSLNPISEASVQRPVPEPKRRIQPSYRRPETAQDQFRPVTYEKPRKTDLWRTTDNRPVCFHCGRPGHVVRYCRERKAVFNKYWADRRGINETRSSYDDFSRPDARSPSPSPARGRSPSRRFRSPSPYRRSSQSPGRRNEGN
jgi:hypothetical protein